MMARFLYLNFIMIMAIGTLSLSPPYAIAQVDLLDTDPQAQEEPFTPPYQDAITTFNAISDDALMAEIMPELETAPSDDELSDETADDVMTDLADEEENDTPSNTDATVTQEDLERYALVPQSVLDDAQDFFHFCETSPSLQSHYQCQCWAKRYLDEAINIGPGYLRDDVVRVINNDCLDVPRMAGISFDQCIGQSLVKPDGKTMEEYCECYGNEYARNISEGTMSMSSRKISAARSLAIEACL